MAIAWSRGGFEVSDDPRRLDLATIEATRYREIHRPDVYKGARGVPA